MSQYAALSKSPRALADGLMLVFQQPVKLSIGQNVSILRQIRNSNIEIRNKSEHQMTEIQNPF
jgi:hypothetical protein